MNEQTTHLRTVSPSAPSAPSAPGPPGAPERAGASAAADEADREADHEPAPAPAADGCDASGPTLTIGVAIAVPEPFATQLRDARRSYGDPQADIIPTHVTILPPTIIAESAMPAVDAHLSEVACQTVPFRVELLGTDTFRPVSPVVFVPLVKGASACAALAAQVRTGPLARSLEFSYHPHVTLGHNIPDAQLDAAEEGSRDVHLEFVADEVVLYLRDTEHNWERRAGFAFEAGSPDGV